MSNSTKTAKKALTPAQDERDGPDAGAILMTVIEELEPLDPDDQTRVLAAAIAFFDVYLPGSGGGESE